MMPKKINTLLTVFILFAPFLQAQDANLAGKVRMDRSFIRDFFALCKEVTDKGSIHTTCGTSPG